MERTGRDKERERGGRSGEGEKEKREDRSSTRLLDDLGSVVVIASLIDYR